MSRAWPQRLPVVQFRIARPTSQLERVVAFYRDGLGMPIIYSYEHDAGYDGVMFGMPGREYHLEFTKHAGDSPCPLPSPDTLLVFYILDLDAIDALLKRLKALGHFPVPPRNPYWARNGITIADPDGWHVVLMHTGGFSSDIE